MQKNPLKCVREINNNLNLLELKINQSTFEFDNLIVLVTVTDLYLIA